MYQSLQHRFSAWVSVCLVLSGLGFVGYASAAEPDTAANRRIYLYQGADREWRRALTHHQSKKSSSSFLM